jgi:hypothetical protein
MADDGDPFDKEDEEYLERLINGYDEMADGNWGGTLVYSEWGRDN